MIWNNKAYRFILRDTFSNLREIPVLKSRTNRILALTIVFFLYAGYWVIGFQNYQSLSRVHNYDATTINYLKKITLSSVSTVAISLSGFSFVIMKSTFRLSPKITYMINWLPFSIKDIKQSIILFETVVGLAMFNLMVAIDIPTLSLMESNPIVILGYVVLMNLWFVISYGLLQLLLNKMDTHKLFRNYSYYVVNVGVTALSMVMFFYLRFKIDYIISRLSITNINVVIALLVLALSIFAYTIFVLVMRNELEPPTKSGKYVHILRVPFNGSWAGLSFLRKKQNISLLMIVGLIILISGITGGYKGVESMVPGVWPMMALGAIYYGGDLRGPHYSFKWLPISIYKEVALLLVFAIMISFPIMIGGQAQLLIKMTTIVLIAIIFSITIPSYDGSFNEFILTAIVVVLGAVILTVNTIQIAILILAVTGMALFYTLNKLVYNVRMER